MKSLFWILLLLLSSCGNGPSTTHISGTAMTIDYNITIGRQLNKQETMQVQTLIHTTFEEIDAIYNKWNPHSEISRINRLKKNERMNLSPQLEKFLIFTEQFVKLSHGRFDPTIEPLQNLWKSHLKDGKEPSDVQIQQLDGAIGWNKIHIANGSIYKDHDLTSLDLGGITKGYCVDLLIERLQAAGFPDLFVEWGGEIRATGQHPDRRAWRIFISRFGNSDPDQALALISLQNQAIATSGDYLQNWEVVQPSGEKKIYFHIIDPLSRKPLEAKVDSVASASVLAQDCATADALATIAMLFSIKEEADIWAEKMQMEFPSVKFWIVSRASAEDH
jgi:thiamine biosynthesis lipoprotein